MPAWMVSVRTTTEKNKKTPPSKSKWETIIRAMRHNFLLCTRRICEPKNTLHCTFLSLVESVYCTARHSPARGLCELHMGWGLLHGTMCDVGRVLTTGFLKCGNPSGFRNTLFKGFSYVQKYSMYSFTDVVYSMSYPSCLYYFSNTLFYRQSKYLPIQLLTRILFINNIMKKNSDYWHAFHAKDDKKH